MKKLERVMLVDDDADVNFYNGIIIEDVGLTDNIVVFQNARKALDYLQTGAKVDLILLDINMPIMTGWEFLEEYEKIKDEQKPIIVVMLTASVNIDDRKKSEAFKHVKKYINKPIDADIIEEILALYE